VGERYGSLSPDASFVNYYFLKFWIKKMLSGQNVILNQFHVIV
jgi:hypothetical protein